MKAVFRSVFLVVVVLSVSSCVEASESPYKNVYEIFVYSFYDSDGDGIGDLDGVTKKLDYISEDLGMNGIWLMPIMPSTTYHKYDVIDYYDVDPEYGTLQDFEKLAKASDQKGIDLIIDFVFNHTSGKHPWFIEATNYLKQLEADEEPKVEECPYIDYYYFSKSRDGNPSYHQVDNTQWYYEGVFWNQMPDLNLDNPAVREEFEAIADFWIEKGVDGFRLDAAKEYHSGGTEKNIEVLRWFQEYVRSVDEDIYVVAEVWDTASTIGAYYQSGVESIFNFPLAQYNGTVVSATRGIGNMTAKRMVETLVEQQMLYANNCLDYTDAPFLSNHDTTRLAAQCMYEEELMKFAAGISMTLPGNLFMYYGEEIGMSSLGDKDENKRLGMRWSEEDAEGLCDGPIEADEVEQRFEALDVQMKDATSLFNYYKRGIALRKKYPAIAAGDYEIVESMTGDSVATVIRRDKEKEKDAIVVIYNLSEEETNVSINELKQNDQLVDYLSLSNEKVIQNEQTITMPKRSIAILQ